MSDSGSRAKLRLAQAQAVQCTGYILELYYRTFDLKGSWFERIFVSFAWFLEWFLVKMASNISQQRIKREFREVVSSEEVAKSGVKIALVDDQLTGSFNSLINYSTNICKNRFLDSDCKYVPTWCPYQFLQIKKIDICFQSWRDQLQAPLTPRMRGERLIWRSRFQAPTPSILQRSDSSPKSGTPTFPAWLVPFAWTFSRTSGRLPWL